MNHRSYVITTRSNHVLAADVGPTVARIIETAQPGWDVHDVSHMHPSERAMALGLLRHEAEIPGVKYQRRVIPARPIKPQVETIDTPYGAAQVISRDDDGFVKFKLATGQVFRLREYLTEEAW